MLGPELLERITARRAELDGLEEQLTKQLAEVRAERDELAVAERVLERVSDQLANERASTGQVGGQAVMLIPHRAPGVEEVTLPPDYQRILAAVRQAADRSWPGRSAKCWEWTSACGPSWNRRAGSWSDRPTEAGSENCPTAGSPPVSD
ncbi:hypothetical protein ACFXKF_38100 [Streptomyces scopuliridis]|uniref:hypothetical protein n=1 Tax=Streptomyces scopuliridis TaxID=452529 RepID=UPI0036C4C591